MWRERFRLELPGESDGSVVLYVKRYHRPPIGAQRQRVVQAVGRHSTAWIVWQWLHRLAADGVARVTPVAFGERMAGWREVGSVLVTEGAAG